jgi:4'-phosphopantetheinyl transferase
MTNWSQPDPSLKLEENTVHIWLSYLNLHEARLKHLYPLLSTEEKERSERFKFYKHRKRFIASHGFMRSVLENYIETPAAEIAFSANDKGKPEFDKKTHKTNVRFNLSHSNNIALLAIGLNHEIGVDIEFLDRKNDWKGIIKRFYTATEQKGILKLSEDQQQKAFFQMWTRKEAYMKVLGLGLHLPPNKFVITVPPAKPALVEHLSDKYTQPDIINFGDIVLPESYGDYCGTFAMLGDISDVNYFIFP